MYALVKYVHVCTAILTICGFVLRGLWMLSGSVKLDMRIVRIAPHVIDTVFLLSGIALIVILQLPVMNQPWLIAKFSALIGYIILGAIALRRGRSMRVRAFAFGLALLTYVYILGVAIAKSTASWLVFM